MKTHYRVATLLLLFLAILQPLVTANPYLSWANPLSASSRMELKGDIEASLKQSCIGIGPIPRGGERDLYGLDVDYQERSAMLVWMIYANKPNRKFRAKLTEENLKQTFKLHPQTNFGLRKTYCDTIETFHKNGHISVFHWGHYENETDLVFFFDGCRTPYCLYDFTHASKVSKDEQKKYGPAFKTSRILFSYYEEKLWDKVRSKIEIARNYSTTNPLRLTFVGYSAGGVVAQMAAYYVKKLIKTQSLPVKVMEIHTVASPKPWSLLNREQIQGKNDFARVLDVDEWVHYRWTLTPDQAPTFPMGFHDGPERRFLWNGDVIHRNKVIFTAKNHLKAKYKNGQGYKIGAGYGRYKNEVGYGSGLRSHALGIYLDSLVNILDGD